MELEEEDPMKMDVPRISRSKKKGTIMDQFDLGEAKTHRDPSQVKMLCEYLECLGQKLRPFNYTKYIGLESEIVDSDRVPVLLPITQDYTDIYRLIENAFEATVNTYILLTGSQGHGRSSAVYYSMSRLMEREKKLRTVAMSEPLLEKYEQMGQPTERPREKAGITEQRYHRQEVRFVEVDAFIYNQDNKLLNYIMGQLAGGESAVEANTYSQLVNLAHDYKIILYIKNVDVFAEETRQSFLYTLLETVNGSSLKMVIIFSANNIYFLDRLEKRVRSRFSCRQFYFEGLRLEEDLHSILKSRFRLKDPKYADWGETLCLALEDPGIKALHSRYIELGNSIRWFIQMWRNALLFIKPFELNELVKTQGVARYLLERLERSKRLLLFEDGEGELLTNMPRPVKVIMLCLQEVTIRRGSDTGLSYEMFRKTIKEVVKDSFAEMGRSSWIFNDNLLKEGLLVLKKMNYVQLDKTPITLETVIQLTDSVSSSFLAIKVDDCEIVFGSKGKA